MPIHEPMCATAPDGIPGDAVQQPAAAASMRHGLFRPATAEGGRADPDTTGDDLARLVLVVVDTVRQLVEKQAIRRVDSGTLTDDEIERLGIALLRLEERMAELKEHFGLTDDDLALRLGGFQDLANETRNG
jgi:hypothetical protein